MSGHRWEAACEQHNTHTILVLAATTLCNRPFYCEWQAPSFPTGAGKACKGQIKRKAFKRICGWSGDGILSALHSFWGGLGWGGLRAPLGGGQDEGWGDNQDLSFPSLAPSRFIQIPLSFSNTRPGPRAPQSSGKVNTASGGCLTTPHSSQGQTSRQSLPGPRHKAKAIWVHPQPPSQHSSGRTWQV